MAYNRFDPGDNCCTGIACRDVLLRPDWPEWDDFALAEGAPQDGLWYAAHLGFTWGLPFGLQRHRRWQMTDGQQLIPPNDVLAPSARAWFHTVEIDGDADLTWDGGTIQLRSSTGTVTAGGETVPIIADGDDASDDSRIRTRLVLYVTEEWYGVFTLRYHLTQINSFPGDPLYATSRSAMQCIDRASDPSKRSVTFTAVGDVSVYGWQIADASVLVEDGVVVGRCSRPEVAMGTEVGYQYQRKGTNSFLFPYNDGVPATYPDTLSFPTVPEVDIYYPWECWTGTPDNIVYNVESYAGPMAAGIARSVLPVWSFEWLDRPSSFTFWTTSDGGIEGPGLDGGAGLLAVATAAYTCCPREQPCGASNAIDMNTVSVYTNAELSLQVRWHGPTADDPYPMPASRKSLYVAEVGDGRIATVDVPFGADGKAPATIQATGHELPVFPDARAEFTALTIAWDSV